MPSNTASSACVAETISNGDKLTLVVRELGFQAVLGTVPQRQHHGVHVLANDGLVTARMFEVSGVRIDTKKPRHGNHLDTELVQRTKPGVHAHTVESSDPQSFR